MSTGIWIAFDRAQRHTPQDSALYPEDVTLVRQIADAKLASCSRTWGRSLFRRTNNDRGHVTAGRRSASLLGGVMEETRYGLKVSLSVPYDDAVELATSALKTQGFGVLTTIDVKQTLKAKLDRDFRKYVILGACNPPLADRALHAELEVGLLLPCNVVVYETGPAASVVAALAPLAALGVVGDNAALAEVAGEADRRLRQALTSLESPVATT